MSGIKKYSELSKEEKKNFEFYFKRIVHDQKYRKETFQFYLEIFPIKKAIEMEERAWKSMWSWRYGDIDSNDENSDSDEC